MKKTVLMVLDGIGIREEEYGNAFKNANTPNFDYLWNNYPHCKLYAAEEPVGLPKGQMGNSEVGHMNIGAGRVMYQELPTINNSIADGSFFNNEVFIDAIENCKKNNSNLHLLGMISDGAVHSHENHLLALLELCKRESFDRVYIHALLDGRDTTPMEAPQHIKKVEDKIKELGIGKIITIQGRYYLMNRDRNWGLTEMAYKAVVNGESDINVKDTKEAFEKEYAEGLTDEFMKPTVIEKVPIEDNDSIISYNFRSDRLIQFCRAFLNPKFKDFDRGSLKKAHFVIMTEYEDEPFYKDVKIAFNKHFPKNTLGEIIADKGLKQLRMAEYEKRLHITFYFSGCRLEPYEGQTDIILERPDVFTYDLAPEMRAYDITEEFLKAMKEDYALYAVNYANGDGVGHSGIYEKVVEAVEHVDKCLGRILKETDLNEYDLIILSDHGNSEHMIEDDGQPDKKHSCAVVPFIICSKDYKLDENYIGKLADVAPTVLTMMGLEIPKEMTGEVLIK